LALGLVIAAPAFSDASTSRRTLHGEALRGVASRGKALHCRALLGMGLVLGLAILASPASADSSLPPAEFDIGGQDEATVIVRAIDRFGPDLQMISVPYGGALAECDKAQMALYGEPYPAASVVQPGHTLLGCYVRDWMGGHQTVVYSGRNPRIATEILRHELGHALGWHPDHRR
jgi:hypothetical protein